MCSSDLGSKNFTGTPINMEGDMKETVLNSIENGASIFFTLSYQNTQELKTSEYWSQYYSIQYDIWKDDVIKYYNIVNDALADLQNKYIVDHDFIVSYDPASTKVVTGVMQATRVPDADEQSADNILIAEMNKLNSENEVKAAERYNNAMIRADRMYPMVDGVRTDEDAYISYMLEAETNIATSLKSDYLKLDEVELTADEKLMVLTEK